MKLELIAKVSLILLLNLVDLIGDAATLSGRCYAHLQLSRRGFSDRKLNPMQIRLIFEVPKV
ncbi:MAG: hypothetical protein ACJ71J_06090 [Nitrososphaeraceae archaeon]